MALLRQLDALDADVVCLEELSDYWTYVNRVLGDMGVNVAVCDGQLCIDVWLQVFQARITRPRV